VIWLGFALCLAAILFAGTRLARYGDAIAEKTGMGRIWIGLVLIAVITTMPELVTSVSSVALVGSPDLALGTLLGSCCFNLLVLALLDGLHRRTPVLSVASRKHAIAAGWGALLIAITGVSIWSGERLSSLAVGWFGMPSVVILMLYLLGMWWMFRSERRDRHGSVPETSAQYDKLDRKTVYIRFALAAAVVIVAGIALSHIGDAISIATGWGSTFVGTLFLAIATSAPELVVVISALRMGAVDLAVGDVLGANMLNMAIIVAVDVAHGPGFVLSSVTGGHITAFVAVAMSLVVIAGLRLRQRRKLLGIVSWYVPVLIALYVVGAYALFASGTGL